jgi:lysophospholipase L1-like esterase
VRPSRVLVIGVAVLTTGLAAGVTGVTGAGIPAHAAPVVNYVALGDSYSAGVGAGSESGSCDQSPKAYPVLWATANSPASFTTVTCSGAKTSDVISTQLSSLSSSTTLVSITIGGNDVGFSSIMETCVLGSTSSCEKAVSAAEQYANSTLPGLLAAMLADIRAHAPNAKIIVLDYRDHQALDNGINDLDGVIAAAAAGNGDPFADVRAQFSGHELCDGAGWLNSITLPIGNSYHPTATGQKDGYLPVFSAAAAAAGQ